MMALLELQPTKAKSCNKTRIFPHGIFSVSETGEKHLL